MRRTAGRGLRLGGNEAHFRGGDGRLVFLPWEAGKKHRMSIRWEMKIKKRLTSELDASFQPSSPAVLDFFLNSGLIFFVKSNIVLGRLERK